MIPNGVEASGDGPSSKVSAGTAVAAADWEPILPIWRFWVLSIVSLSSYLPFWAASVARDLKRRQGARIRPWLWFVGILAGVTAPIVMAMLCRHIDRLARDRGGSTGPTSILIVALAVPAAAFALAGFGVADAVATEPRQAFDATWILLGGFALLVPLPASLLQWKLNRLKQAFDDPEQPRMQQKFTAGQFAVLAFGSVTWLLALYASPLDRIFVAPGEIHRVEIAGSSGVSGLSGGYLIAIQGEGWTRTPYYAVPAGVDLELHGSLGATVLVYVHDDGRTLEEIVTARHRTLRRTVADFTADNNPLPGSDSVTSHARYGGVNPQGFRETTWLVTTVTTSSGAIEVVGLASGSDNVQSEVEAIVRSIRVDPSIESWQVTR